jgi:hypothetical protein
MAITFGTALPTQERSMGKELEILVEHLPGYGSPSEWHVHAVYDNRLLESAVCGSEMSAGEARAQLRAKWTIALVGADISALPLFSLLCNHCGLDCRSGGGGTTSCLSKTWCHRPECRKALDEAIAESKRQEEARHVADQNRQADEREERLRRAEEAKTGFHWRDNWFFKRMPDASVRVSHVTDEWFTQLVIPQNEWASIVCSVSAAGETGERWEASQDFHGRFQADGEVKP